MRNLFSLFWSSEEGQDFVEYALLLGFVCLAGVAAFVTMGGASAGLWTAVNNRLAANNVS
jgi:Flp pilus assembly pilin Flp